MLSDQIAGAAPLRWKCRSVSIAPWRGTWGVNFRFFSKFFWGDFFAGDLVTWDTVGTWEQTAFLTRDTHVANRLAGMLTDP